VPPRLNWLLRTIRIDCKSTESRARRPAPLNQLPIFTSAAMPQCQKKPRLYKRGAAMQRSIDQFAMRPLNSLVTLA
jgi:hypothetical protein